MPTTTQILADRILERACGERCVEWAIGLLEDGYEQLPVCRLAAKLRPHNHFELASLRDQILDLLELAPKTDEEILTAYAGEILLEAANGTRNRIEAITEVKDLCIVMDYLPTLYDFYSLYFAWEDLQYSTEQYHWAGATRSNIESLIDNRILEFLRTNETA
ncbi:MAG: hypothetical protein P8J91_04255 [Pirellulaceae bacterium]|nr:hypothetical protein [Pirellulaceae bacterium]MDG2102939.1 hypothetical protein [Pirellulaceae bacterium]